MSRLVFDLETDGLLDEVTKIHCIAFKDISDPAAETQLRYTQCGIDEAIWELRDADEIIAHNSIGFDFQVIRKLYPAWIPTGKVTDTLVLSRLVKADLAADDHSLMHNRPQFLKRLYGSHSLRAWGMRLGNNKGDYDGGWENYSDAMGDYCKQDVEVTATLYKLLTSQNFDSRAIALEHDLAEICDRIGSAGWTFDTDKAGLLYGELVGLRSMLEDQLNTLFEPWEEVETFIPKRDNMRLGYVKGQPFLKRKTVTFNHNSRKHIAHCLKTKYGWEPTELTPGGDAKIDESVLSTLEYPEAQKLAEMFLIQKRIAMLAEGSQAWLKKVDDDGRIRHSIISGGTVSGRAAHRNPNLGQVPGAQSKWGKECRELFTVPEGWVLLGADLSGLELRALAHYLAPLDDGEYAETILNGDIHTLNQKAAGLPTRASAKTFIYATLYGGGDRLIGGIVGGKARDGKRLKANFDKAVPAFKRLKDKLKVAMERGYLIGLDGRKLYCRSTHKGLSQLLQSAGAILCKQWLQNIDQRLEIEKLRDDAIIVGWIHDEVQIACRTRGVADYVGDISRRMASEAGRSFSLKIPIAAEFKIGKTWAETH